MVEINDEKLADRRRKQDEIIEEFKDGVKDAVGSRLSNVEISLDFTKCNSCDDKPRRQAPNKKTTKRADRTVPPKTKKREGGKTPRPLTNSSKAETINTREEIAKEITSLEKACKVAGISHSSYSKRKQVIEYGDPTIISKMDTGEMSINEAYREIKKKKRRRTNTKKEAGGKDKLLQNSADPKPIDNREEEIAKSVGCSRDTVAEALYIEKYGDPTIISRIETGEMSINEAYKEVRKKKRQRDRSNKKEAIE